MKPGVREEILREPVYWFVVMQQALEDGRLEDARTGLLGMHRRLSADGLASRVAIERCDRRLGVGGGFSWPRRQHARGRPKCVARSRRPIQSL